MSADGRSFTPRLRIPTEGTPHHPQLALDGAGHLVAVWDELANGTRHVAMAQASASAAAPSFTRRVLSATEPGVYPVVARTNDGMVVAWTSGAAAKSVVRVERLGGQ